METTFALIRPDGAIDRIVGGVDPTVGTKQGWRWLPVVETPRPGLGPGQTRTREDVVDGEAVVRRWVVTDAPLNQLREILSRQIDDDAEVTRLRYITPGVGMSMTYREKLEQAEQVMAGGEAAAGAMSADQAIAAYPTLAASIGIEAPTLWGCANIVWSKYQAWCALSYTIEKTRLAAKQAIGQAADQDAARAAYSAITWP